MKKNITLIILCGLLIGCAGSGTTFENASLEPARVYENEMGMILTQVRVSYVSVLNQPGAYNGYLILRNINTNSKYRVDGVSYDDSISMLVPGIYQIDRIGWSDGAYNYSFKVSTKESDVNLKFGAFKVGPGECLYLGDITLNKNSLINDKLVISDQSSQMLQSIKDVSLNNLRSRIKFYSLIRENQLIKKNSNGKYDVYQGEN